MTEQSGRIEKMGILDLTWAESAEDLGKITSIEKVGVVLVPEHLHRFVLEIPMKEVGLVRWLPSGPKKVLSGQIRVTGEFLAGGDEETTLVVAGQLIVTPPVERIGFKGLYLMGQMVLPRGSEELVSTKLDMTGQMIYYGTDKGTPRFFLSKETIGREFLELLPAAVPWVIVGNVTIEDDVTPDLLRDKVPEITLVGTLVAPKTLIPLLQVLAIDKFGKLLAKEEIPCGEGTT